MEGSNSNHAQDNLPDNHSYTIAPNTNQPTYNIGDLVIVKYWDAHGNPNVEHDAIITLVKWANNQWQYNGIQMNVAPFNNCGIFQNYNDSIISTTYENGDAPNDHACFHS